jgi:hypothetical protein
MFELLDLLVWLADNAGTHERPLEPGLLLDAAARFDAINSNDFS